MSTTILTADDDRAFRQLVQSLLRQDGAVAVVGEAENGEDAVHAARVLRPDIVLLDITMPRTDGFAATRLIKANRPQTRVIVVTVHAERSYERAATESGADAFIAKKRLGSELLPTIHRLIGKTPSCPADPDQAACRDSDQRTPALLKTPR